MQPSARQLLRDAARLLCEHPRLLRAARSVRSFHDGARWMRLAMRTARGERVPRCRRSLEWIGWRKYLMCGIPTSLLAAMLCGLRASWLLPLCAPFFYVSEVQHVFDVPLAIDRIDRRAHRRLAAACGGTWHLVPTVMTVAAVMLFGGFAGGGFVRSWCVGCAAIVLMYEDARTRRDQRQPPAVTRPVGFEFGAGGPIRVRHERVSMPVDRPTRLLYVSDLHLGNRWSRIVVDQLGRLAACQRPDAIMLGGDMADSAAGLRPLRRLLTAFRAASPIVVAVLGNHDRWSRGVPIREALAAADVTLLERAVVHLNGLKLIGDPSRACDPSRTVLCAHDPSIYSIAREHRIRLTLAGHLHGGQCVLRLRHGRQQWPGWLINRWTITRRDDPHSTLIVSNGVADSLPLRFNCPREVVMVEITDSDSAAKDPR